MPSASATATTTTALDATAPQGAGAPGLSTDAVSSGSFAPAPSLPTRLHVGSLPTGAVDGITDVPGVLVGHVTKNDGYDIHDGATVVMPAANPWLEKDEAATYMINGNGALTNRDDVDQFGRIESPILLVGNTMNIPNGYNGVEDAMIAKNPQIGRRQDVPLPMVGEIDGQRLNNAPARAVTSNDISSMIARAHGGDFERGSVGAGTPSVAFGYKAGIGSSSRVLPQSQGGYTVGVLVNANMDVRDHLTMGGAPVGKLLPQGDMPQTDPQRYRNHGRSADGSIIIVVATDAPLTSLQLKQLAKRTAIGLYRSGSISRISSGDQVVAFSTSRVTRMDPATGKLTPSQAPEITDEDTLNRLYEASGDATESAIDNSLLSSASVGGRQAVYHGNGSMVHGIPANLLLRILANPPRATVNGDGSIAAPNT